MTSSPGQEAAAIAQLEARIETQKGENAILRQKLQSKTEALLILTKELDKSRADVDDQKELVSRLQAKCAGLKGAAAMFYIAEPLMDGQAAFNSRSYRDQSISKHISDLRQDNKRLLSERENLRRVLEDRTDDVKLLRSQLTSNKSSSKERLKIERVRARRAKETEELVSRLEKLQIKYASLKQDLQSLLDEKQDLVQERDAYKCKVHRLNHSLNALLKSEGYKTIDLDWLLAENRFLTETVRNLREEKDLANEMGRRYKSALEKSKRLSSSSSSSVLLAKDDLSKKLSDELVALVAQTSFPCPPGTDLNSTVYLQELCMSLLETLNDRMTQLKHQRRSNKHILAKLSALEEQLRSHLGEDKVQLLLTPSEYLLRGYHSSEVDSAAVQEEAQEHQQNQGEESSRPSSTQEFTDDTENSVEPLAEVKESSKCEELAPPPDLISENMPRTSYSEEEEEGEEPKVVEESITLPDHLQSMVDQAMEQLLLDD